MSDSKEESSILPEGDDVKRVRKLEMVDNKFMVLEEGKTAEGEGETREQVATGIGSNDRRAKSNIGFKKLSPGGSMPSSKGEKVEYSGKPSSKKGSILPDVFAKPHL